MNTADYRSAMLRTEPASFGACCVRCHEWTYAPVPVGYIERPSGPGWTQYACPTDAVSFGAGPTPEDLLDRP